MLEDVAKKILLRLRITHIKSCYGALKTEEERDRYPFIYSRDSSIIAMALDTLGKYSWVEKHYDFMQRVQFHTGEWVQRYNHQAQPAISRPRETDATALVVCGMCSHYLKTKNKEFIKKMWPSLYLGIKYLEQMIKDNGLVYGRHAIHENKDVEEGFEIWTNSWTCRAFQLASEVAKLLNKKSLSNKLKLEHQQLLNNILEKMWSGKHFIKTIKPDGKIIDGKMYHGKGQAGELGHITVEPAGFKCPCGNRGCLEEYVSVRAIQKAARAADLTTTGPEEVQRLAAQGNKLAAAVYSEAGRYLGIGLSDIIKILDPELILLGGGIAKARELILKPAEQELKKRVFFKPPKVKFTNLGDWAGAIGAAYLFLR